MVSKFKQYNGADEYRGQSTGVKPVANNGIYQLTIEDGVATWTTVGVSYNIMDECGWTV